MKKRRNEMPYDPRPISKGGNRGIDEKFTRIAPKGQFRVVGVDTFDGGDWKEGDFETFEEAKKIADKKSGQITKMYVYNDKGEYLYDTGAY